MVIPLGWAPSVGTLSWSELTQLWQPVIFSPSHVLGSSWLCPQLHHSFLVLSTSTWNEKLVAALWAISCFLMKSIGLLEGKKTLTHPTLNEVICFHGVTGALYFPSSLKKLTTFRYIQRSRDEIYLVRTNPFQWKKTTRDPSLRLPRLSTFYPMLWTFCLSASTLISRCLWGPCSLAGWDCCCSLKSNQGIVLGTALSRKWSDISDLAPLVIHSPTNPP